MRSSAPSSADTSAAVDAFMLTLKHPHKAAIAEFRRIIRDADPSILEGVKWNAPSFRTTGYFATTHLRDRKGVGLILHLGAKIRASARPEIKDSKKLLTWLAKDRAMVSFAGLEDVQAQEAALKGIVRQWIKFV
jgi:hypothetical protein